MQIFKKGRPPQKPKRRQHKELSRAQQQEITEAFQLWKINDRINQSDLFQAMKALGINRTKQELSKVITQQDSEGKKTMSFQDFYDYISHIVKDRDPIQNIRRVFRMFDDDQTQKLSFINLRRVAKELGQTLTDQQLQGLIQQADRDGDNEIDQQQFIRIMTKTHLF